MPQIDLPRQVSIIAAQIKKLSLGQTAPKSKKHSLSPTHAHTSSGFENVDYVPSPAGCTTVATLIC